MCVLSHFLENAAENRTVVITQNERVHRDYFTKPKRSITEFHPPLTNIAIAFTSNADLLRALYAIDGQAQTLLLLSPTLSSATANLLMDMAGTEALYADKNAFDGATSHPISSMDELLCAHTRTPGAPAIETIWLLATSGTTSTPKLVPHTLASLTRTVREARESSAFIWGQLYDSYRFAGMQVVLQALAGQSTLVAPTTNTKLCDKLALFAREGVNALSATPTLWRKILMVKNSKELELRSITLGGEIADDSILAALATRFPDAKIRHIYASTEAGAGFSVTDGRSGFPVSFLADGVGGIGLKIIDDILYVQNTLVSGTYLGGGETFLDEDKYVNTGDRVRVEADRVYFLGRLSGVINVGGDKVSPETVEIILNDVDDVSLSRVYGKKSPLMGELVVAEIVITNGADKMNVRKQLMQTCKDKLESYQRPIAYRFVGSIKVSENGKVVRL